MTMKRQGVAWFRIIWTQYVFFHFYFCFEPELILNTWTRQWTRQLPVWFFAKSSKWLIFFALTMFSRLFYHNRINISTFVARNIIQYSNLKVCQLKMFFENFKFYIFFRNEVILPVARCCCCKKRTFAKTTIFQTTLTPIFKLPNP